MTRPEIDRLPPGALLYRTDPEVWYGGRMLIIRNDKREIVFLYVDRMIQDLPNRRRRRRANAFRGGFMALMMGEQAHRKPLDLNFWYSVIRIA